MSLSTFGGFVSSQPLEVELCSVHAAFRISGRLWRCEHCKALCFAGGLCVAFFFQSCRCSVEIVSTLVPAKRIDTLAKNRFFLRSSYYYYVESVLSDVLFPSFRNTTAVQIELNNVPYTFSVPKNMTSSSSKSQNPPGVLDFLPTKRKKHNKKHIHHSKIKNSWAIDFHIHINHQVGPGVDLNDGSL